MNGLAVVHSYHGLLLLSEKGNKLKIEKNQQTKFDLLKVPNKSNKSLTKLTQRKKYYQC